jgi:hypothetical protein
MKSEDAHAFDLSSETDRCASAVTESSARSASCAKNRQVEPKAAEFLLCPLLRLVYESDRRLAPTIAHFP